MSVHVSISPDKPTLSLDGTYWLLRIAPDALIVMTEEQAANLWDLLREVVKQQEQAA